MAECAQTKALENLLECPICFEISRPPIYACVIGHLICNECAPKVEMCPICRSKYTGTRNFTAEDLCRNLNSLEDLFGDHQPKEEHPFEKFQKPIAKLSTEAEEDIEQNLAQDIVVEDPNEFRPIMCCLFTDECRNSTVDFFLYFDHLRTVHKVVSVEQGCSIHTKRQNIKGNQFVRNGSSKLFIMNCFDRHFLISMHQENLHVWIWAALHGSEEETTTFRVRFTIKHKDLEDITWMGKVHAIRKTADQIQGSGAFLRVKIEDLRKRIIKFGWTIQAHIFKSNTILSSNSLGSAVVADEQTQGQRFETRGRGVEIQYVYPTSMAMEVPPRPPIPRSHSLNQNHIRQPVSTKSEPPPLPPGPPTIIRQSSRFPTGQLIQNLFNNIATPLSPVPRSQSLSQIRQSATKAPAPPLPVGLPAATRGLSASNSRPAQPKHPSLDLLIRSESFQAQNSNERPAREIISISRTPDDRPRSVLYSPATTSTGFRPVTWETATTGSTSLDSRGRTTFQNTTIPTVKTEKQKGKDCIIM